MNKKYKLDAYEQDIEDNFEQHINIKNVKEETKLIEEVARKHTKSKRSITLRVSEQDIEAIKIKASKCGIPYQTYINMLIHLDATKL